MQDRRRKEIPIWAMILIGVLYVAIVLAITRKWGIEFNEEDFRGNTVSIH